MKPQVVVAVSGPFDPLHIGHLRMMRDARALGDRLVVILNDDEWLMRKHGYILMPQEDRKELLESIQWVDEVVIREPRDTYDVCHMLEQLPINIFANGGNDRRNEMEIPEAETCARLGIEMKFGIGGTDKPRSSSHLIRDLARQVKDFDKLRETGKAV